MIAWAKLKHTEFGVRWHSLVAHSADTGAVMERLLAVPTIAGRLAQLMDLPALDPVLRARLALLAAIHDMGKVNCGFWGRQFDRPDLGRRGHIGPVVDLLERHDAPRQQSQFIEAMRLDLMFAWTGGKTGLEPLLNAVLMHHGRLPPARAVERRLWQPGDGYDPATELDRLGAALDGWFPEAFSAEPLPSLPPCFLHAYAGLVMLADWIASDEAQFPFAAEATPERIALSRALANRAIARFHLDPVPERDAARRLVDPVPLVLGPGRLPRPAQAAMAAVRVESGSTLVLEAETGSGKTEAALLHFLHLFRAGKVDGLYFALPTRAAAVQIHRRISEAVKAVLGAAAPPVVLAVPGYLRVDDRDGMRLPGFQVQWPDDPDDAWRDRAWAAEHPKRYLAAPIAVGTVDQVMLGGLNVRHAHLRSAPMLRQLLVIDEVHASDVYMERVVCNLLAQHRKAGGHALLMSATLGYAARLRLMGENPRNLRRPPPVEELAALPYPMLHGNNAEVPDLPLGNPAAKRVAVELVDPPEGNQAIAARAMAAAMAGARVLVIRNRVDDAVETGRLVEAMATQQGRPGLILRCAGQATVHHGRFAPADRRLLDAALEAALGRDSREPVVAVTTQTAEQSLDIDADLLITDLCPADVLLQRFGRLHRHDRPDRPPGFAAPRALVVAPAEDRLAGLLREDGEVRGRLLGLGKVYPDLLALVATRRTLAELGTVEIPRHNRLLVERATHRPYLEGLVKSLGERWKKHLSKTLGAKFATGQVAALNLLEFNKAIAPTLDLEGRIATRLGLGSRLLPLDPPGPGPFGAPVPVLAFPGWMVQGLAEEALPQDLQPLPEGGFAFSLGEQRFRYDRWGLTRG